jgi:hypothetical protein
MSFCRGSRRSWSNKLRRFLSPHETVDPLCKLQEKRCTSSDSILAAESCTMLVLPGMSFCRGSRRSWSNKLRRFLSPHETVDPLCKLQELVYYTCWMSCVDAWLFAHVCCVTGAALLDHLCGCYKELNLCNIMKTRWICMTTYRSTTT